MSILLEELQNRKHEVALQIEKLEKSLQNAPESRLRVSMRKGHPRFYEVTGKGDTTGKYLTNDQGDRIKRLAQADYEKKALFMLRKESRLINALVKFYERANSMGEEFFSGPEELLPGLMIPARRELIVPITMDQKAYTENWLADSYERKGFSENAPVYMTKSKIRVRSKTEWMIAEMLENKEVPFYYERPIVLHGIGKIHPDFIVLNRKRRKTYFWEHLGMLDNETYRANALNRIEQYILNGYYPGRNLILTYESATNPINSKIIEKTIDTYLLT